MLAGFQFVDGYEGGARGRLPEALQARSAWLVFVFVVFVFLAQGPWSPLAFGGEPSGTFIEDCPSIEQAPGETATNGKSILAMFTAGWCGYCRKMDTEVLSRTDVKAILQNMVLMRLDFDQEASLAQEYGVTGVPYFLLMDDDLRVQKRMAGPHKAAEFLSEINEFLMRKNGCLEMHESIKVGRTLVKEKKVASLKACPSVR